VDLDFCRTVVETYGSAETDIRGYYQFTLPAGCVDIRVSKPGYIQSGPVPYEYCTPGSSLTHQSEGFRVDLQMSPLEPTVVISGGVTSAVDGTTIGGAQISVYSETDAAEPIAVGQTAGISYPPNSSRGRYSISVDCEEILYVQATECQESRYDWLNCTGWVDSERVPITSDCPERGSPAVRHHVDFVLDPISE
jgi:hypothetical protein